MIRRSLMMSIMKMSRNGSIMPLTTCETSMIVMRLTPGHAG